MSGSYLNASSVSHGNLVAGASAEGYGVLVGWSGAGEMTRARLVGLATRATIPAEWLPSPKDAGVQLTRAIQAAAGTAYSAERVAKSTWSAETEPREWSSRWLLVARTVGGDLAFGSAFGTVALVATLYPEGELVIVSGVDGLEAAVRADFDARIGSETYVAADVTAWLSRTIRDQLSGVKYGGNWYVPRASRFVTEALCESFRTGGWGRAWMTPPLPIASSAQLALGVANGLSDEAGEIAGAIREARANAIAAGKLDIGERAAITMMAKLRNVGERIGKWSAILGDAVETCQIALQDAMIELDSVLGSVEFEKEWSFILNISGKLEA